MKPAKIFSDHTVFAEGKPIRVFGEGDRPVAVSFLGSRAEAVPSEGKWQVELPASPAGGPFTMEITDGEETVTLRDVYVGRVFYVMGQSNVEFRLSESNTPKSYYETDPLLCSFFVDRPWDPDDPFHSSDGWRTAKAEEVGNWSAIGYLTARIVRRELGCAVGIVCCYKGASVIESWLPREKAERYRLPPECLYEDHTLDIFANFNGDGEIYEKMLTKVTPFSPSALVWYQGESDSTVEEVAVYGDGIRTFFDEFRRLVGDEDLPVAMVQIADCDYRKEVLPDGWVAMQEKQREVAESDPRITLVVSRDVCESDNMHPATKTLLSERIARALLKYKLGLLHLDAESSFFAP